MLRMELFPRRHLLLPVILSYASKLDLCHPAEAVKRSIAKVENTKDNTSTSFTIQQIAHDSRPQEPLALVAKMSDSE